VLEQLPFVEGYGVDLGLLIDVAARFGPTAIAQVDLGRRVHRNRTLDELGPQALAVLQTALHRAAPGLTPEVIALLRPGSDPVPVDVTTRPALIDVDEYRARHRR
jgi:glucosyl-3-phosphoglycerate synthase